MISVEIGYAVPGCDPYDAVAVLLYSGKVVGGKAVVDTEGAHA